MEPSLVVALIALAGTLVSAVLVYRASRLATRVNARAVDVNEAANQLEWVKELRKAQGEAEQHADELDERVKDLRRQLEVATREAEQLVAELQLFRRTAWRDGMTIDRLRAFIGPPPASANGRSV